MSFQIHFHSPDGTTTLREYEQNTTISNIIASHNIPTQIQKRFKLFLNHRYLDDTCSVYPLESLIPSGSPTHLHTLTLVPLLVGGKGGFGNNLRSGMIKRKKTQPIDHSAMRDLNGRRLADVQHAEALQEWVRLNEVDPRRVTVQRSSSSSPSSSSSHGGSSNNQQKQISQSSRAPELNSHTAIGGQGVALSSTRDQIETSPVGQIDAISDTVKSVIHVATTVSAIKATVLVPEVSSSSDKSDRSSSDEPSPKSPSSTTTSVQPTQRKPTTSSYGLGLDFSSSDDDDDDDSDEE